MKIEAVQMELQRAGVKVSRRDLMRLAMAGGAAAALGSTTRRLSSGSCPGRSASHWWCLADGDYGESDRVSDHRAGRAG